MSSQRSGGSVYDSKFPYMVYGNPGNPWLMYPQTGPMQYPHQSAAANTVQPPPPLVYPMQNVPSGVSNPLSGAEGQQIPGFTGKPMDEPTEVLIERGRAASPKPEAIIDDEADKEKLDEPLTPLPPPLEPVKLSSAKKAAVLSGYKLDGKFYC